jgi:hypothetical protein
MVEFNENDFNLVKISNESKLGNLVTRFKYRVYGLKQEGNPPILIEYHYNRVDEGFEERVQALVKFLKTNGGITLTVNHAVNTKGVDVGLRRDLRAVLNKNEKPMFASGIISTIIYCLEGRIDLKELQRYKVSVVPRLLPAKKRAA